MLNITKSYAKVWEIEDKGNYIQAKIGSSRKDKRDGSYINSNWYVRFVGSCKDLAKDLQKGDRIVIKNAIVENVYSKEHNRSYLNVTVFDFEVDSQTSTPGFDDVDDFPDDDLPFN